jgi:hypothetical protein
VLPLPSLSQHRRHQSEEKGRRGGRAAGRENCGGGEERGAAGTGLETKRRWRQGEEKKGMLSAARRLDILT